MNYLSSFVCSKDFHKRLIIVFMISKSLVSDSFIVEASILDQKLVLSCGNSMTVSGFQKLVLEEYYVIYPRAQPIEIKCIRDSKDRILSSRLLMVNVEHELFVEICGDEEIDSVDPETINTTYRKWQLYTARQIHEYIQTNSRQERVLELTPLSLRLIEEFKHSSDDIVKSTMVGSLSVMLTHYLMHPRVISFAENQVHEILETTNSIDLTIQTIRLFKHFSRNVDVKRVKRNIESILGRFTTSQTTILACYEEIGGDAMVTRKANFGQNRRTDIDVKSVVTINGANGPEQSSGLGDSRFKKIEKYPKFSPTEEPDVVDFSRPIGTSVSAAGMHWDRVKSLLLSDDRQCRQYAISKCSAAISLAALPQPEVNTDVDSILAGHEWIVQSDSDVASKFDSSRVVRPWILTSPTDAEDMAQSLLHCMKTCIHTPSRSTVLGANEVGFAAEAVDNKPNYHSVSPIGPKRSHANSFNSKHHGVGALKAPSADYDTDRTADKDENDYDVEHRVASSVASNSASVLRPSDGSRVDNNDILYVPQAGHSIGGRSISSSIHNNIDYSSSSGIGEVVGLEKGFSEPLAAQLINAALCTRETDVQSLKGCLICLERLCSEWQYPTLRALRAYGRLLMTLSHASPEHTGIAEISSGLVLALLFVPRSPTQDTTQAKATISWEGSNLSLENSAIPIFLEGSQYSSRTLLALTYLLHLQKWSGRSVSIAQGAKSSQDNIPSSHEIGGLVYPGSSLEMLAVTDNFRVIKALWRWALSQDRNARLLALELLSYISVYLSARKFLVRFEAVSKLLSLLSTVGEYHITSAGGNPSGIDIACAQFIVKTVVNLCATNETAKKIVYRKFIALIIPSGKETVRFADIAKTDDILSFYLGILK